MEWKENENLLVQGRLRFQAVKRALNAVLNSIERLIDEKRVNETCADKQTEGCESIQLKHSLELQVWMHLEALGRAYLGKTHMFLLIHHQCIHLKFST